MPTAIPGAMVIIGVVVVVTTGAGNVVTPVGPPTTPGVTTAPGFTTATPPPVPVVVPTCKRFAKDPKAGTISLTTFIISSRRGVQRQMFGKSTLSISMDTYKENFSKY